MKIALLGNPNTGKSSVFNMLTGLRQHVGNFPGVTVDKKVGSLKVDDQECELIDFPGTYSIYPHSKDEQVVYDVLSDKNHDDFPEVAVVVIDSSNLQRNLFLFSQVYDLGIPTVMVLNMSDLVKKKGKVIDEEALQKQYSNAVVVSANARVGLGKDRVLDAISKAKELKIDSIQPEFELAEMDDVQAQEQEAEQRHQKIAELINKFEKKEEKDFSKSSKIDRILVHPFWGYLIFGVILMVIFQFIFSFASYPMDWIDGAFADLASWTEETMPEGVFSDLISQGIIPGIGGVVIFIPQIALLFFFIAILEESGYLARVVFIMDRLMRPFGLNGRSVVPLMSSVACAIPGVMAARTIPDWKERMITILVSPLMSCSARIPVYTLLIALVIPEQDVLGVFNLRGLVLFALYALGLIAALLISWVLKQFIGKKNKGFLMLELPSYKMPRWGNVGVTVFQKVKVFVFDAGKIILAISIVLWALASYGPRDDMELAAKQAIENVDSSNFTQEETDQLVASAKLEHSYIGIMGKAIEPAIEPLGYDWKMGISLITSFAAREVFVGSLATIYAVHDDGEENRTLKEKLRNDKNSFGKPTYTLATGVSLMVFYVFAMQCMATLAVVKRETKSWKWPLIQLVFMGALAYIGALITYNVLS